MKLLFFTEARLQQTVEGRFYSADQSFSYQMFKRYLKTFDKVLVIARSSLVGNDVVDETTRVDNAGISVLPLPYYIGPYQYLANKVTLIKTLGNYLDSNSDAAIICRVPGIVGTLAARWLVNKKRPYGVEVVGDPHDVFAPGSFNHPLRVLFRYSGIKNLKTVVKNASAAIYVTRKSLQERYPTANNVFSTSSSNVMLPPEAFVAEAKVLKKACHYSIVAVGALAAMYKSPDIAIEAMTNLKKRGRDVSLRWLGDGRYRSEMVELTRQAGIADKVTFIGNIDSAEEVRQYLDAADLFVLPSRTEGLPRAMVEAMARGLPCIGTDIGGIPELLAQEALVPINNASWLAEKIDYFLNTSKFSDAQAKRNLAEAQSYAFDILEGRRLEFYQYLKSVS